METPGIPTTTASNCGLSIDDHIESTMMALTIFDLGVGCETQYQALLVIAEVAKLLHGHAIFDPSDLARDLLKRALAAQTGPHTTHTAIPDDLAS